MVAVHGALQIAKYDQRTARSHKTDDRFADRDFQERGRRMCDVAHRWAKTLHPLLGLWFNLHQLLDGGVNGPIGELG
jgi:hypothetical protein